MTDEWTTPSPWINQEFLADHPEWEPQIDAEEARWQGVYEAHEAGLTWHQYIAAQSDVILAALQHMGAQPEEDVEELKAQNRRQHDSIVAQAATITQMQAQLKDITKLPAETRRQLVAQAGSQLNRQRARRRARR